jgi:hypothetical protein
MDGVYISCPGAQTLILLLQKELGDMTVEYKQWVVTDRATLMTVIQQSDRFIESLVSKVSELTHHHCTAKQQARYLKESTESLQSDQCIILADVSENCSFILQDAIQGFHWANNQAPLHLSLFAPNINTCKLCPSV